MVRYGRLLTLTQKDDIHKKAVEDAAKIWGLDIWVETENVKNSIGQPAPNNYVIKHNTKGDLGHFWKLVEILDVEYREVEEKCNAKNAENGQSS